MEEKWKSYEKEARKQFSKKQKRMGYKTYNEVAAEIESGDIKPFNGFAPGSTGRRPKKHYNRAKQWYSK